MSIESESVGTSVEIMGKIYEIKCPQTEILSLQSAARYLEEQMQAIRRSGNALSVDRIAIVTALNIVHQLLTSEEQKNYHLQSINQRLHALQNKVENALLRQEDQL